MSKKIRIAYSTKIFLLIASILAICEGAFLVFQYYREQAFREEKLNAQLNIINHQLLDHFEGGIVDVEEWVRTIDLPIRGLQMSIFDKDGNVIYDYNSTDDLNNVLELPSVKMALKNSENKGFHIKYFPNGNFLYFAALQDGDIIVRSAALGHNMSLGSFMEIDRSFVWYAIIIYILVLIVAWMSTRQLGITLKRLTDFADRAENGAPIYDTEEFPNNELGKISHNIIRLYAQLQHASAERDRHAAIAMREEQEKIQMKRELTNNINHELKTPVSAITLELETIINNRGRLTDEQRDMLIDRAKANSDRLLRMIQDILTLNRMEDGKDAIQKEDISLHDIIDEVLESCEMKALAAGIDYDIDLPNDDMMINGNGPLLESIFRNLLVNCINYSGASLFTIRLEDEDKHSFRIKISDNGSGIPEEHFEHIFDRFYRLEHGRSRKKGGTGMGLAIVKNAAMFHGGDISIRNIPSGGLEYTLILSKN